VDGAVASWIGVEVLLVRTIGYKLRVMKGYSAAGPTAPPIHPFRASTTGGSLADSQECVRAGPTL